jgi:hypothetical protein
MSSANLTTTFTPPASCASEWTQQPGSGPVTLVNYISDPDYSLVSTCYPPGLKDQSGPTYSPGLICPVGYTTAYSGIVEPATVAYCCPRYMTPLSCCHGGCLTSIQRVHLAGSRSIMQRNLHVHGGLLGGCKEQQAHQHVYFRRGVCRAGRTVLCRR